MSNPEIKIQDTNELEWPMPRRDKNLTARSPGKANIKNPEVISRFQYDTNGKVDVIAQDINGDGVAEYLFCESGKIKVRDNNGHIIWETSIINPQILGIYDLSGDGFFSVAAITKDNNLTIYSAQTGEVLWSYGFGNGVYLFPYFVRVGRITSFLRGLQITVWPQGHDYGYMFAFDKGVENAYILWKVPGVGKGDLTRYRPNVVIGDIEGEGKNSIIITEHSVIWGYDADTGKKKWEITGPHLRNYGFAGLFDINGDNRKELILVNDAVQPHMSAIIFSQSEQKYLWDKYYGMRDSVVKTTSLPISDIDGDGLSEIFFNVIDRKTNKRKAEVLDAITGEAKYILENVRILDNKDIDGDGICELLIEDTDDQSIEILKLKGGLEKRYKISDNCTLLYSRHYYPIGQSHLSNIFCNSLIKGRDSSDIVIQEKGFIKILSFEDNEIAEKSSVKIDESAQISAISGSLENPEILIKSGQTFKSYSYDGKLICAFDILPNLPAPDFISDTPKVTDIDRDNNMEIIIGDKILSYDGDCIADKYIKPGCVKTILGAWDIDFDGEKELVGEGYKGDLVIFRANGGIILSKNIKSGSQNGHILYCTAGNFTGQNHLDLFVVSYTDDPHLNDSEVINGITGESLWIRNDGHDRGMGPLEGYAVIKDFDGDGLEDIMFLSSSVIIQLDGATGELLAPKTSVDEVIGSEWVGYGLLSLIDVDGDGDEEIFLSGIWGLNGGVLRKNKDTFAPVWFDYYGNETHIQSPPRRRHQGLARANGKILAGGQFLTKEFCCSEADTGALLWKYPLNGYKPGEICTADIDGDGNDEFIFGANDGYLYSIKSDGTLHFKLFLGAPVNFPVLCDINGDGDLEIVVTTGDGYINIIGQKEVTHG